MTHEEGRLDIYFFFGADTQMDGLHESEKMDFELWLLPIQLLFVLLFPRSCIYCSNAVVAASNTTATINMVT